MTHYVRSRGILKCCTGQENKLCNGNNRKKTFKSNIVMSEGNRIVSDGVRKPSPFKPPVPARPKNLVIWNSKNLPKPPQNVLTGRVTNFVKAFNLDSQDENGHVSHDTSSNSNSNSNSNSEKNASTPNSDEEDIDGYLEPVSISFNNILLSGGKHCNSNATAQKIHSEESEKVKSVQRFPSSQNAITKEKEKGDSEDPKLNLSHSQRPLPLPPVKKESEIFGMPWYKNVDRKRGEELLKNGVDGHFLIRPSSKEDTFLTLTLWFHNRSYNIPIRKRKDGKFALGTPKTNEQCFESIEEMVKHYQSEKLLLYSNGVKAGRTLLTIYPP